MADKVTKGVRITGDDRVSIAAEIEQRYLGGETVRAIATDLGRSYGFVHGLLKEQGVNFRARGGDTRKKTN